MTNRMAASLRMTNTLNWVKNCPFSDPYAMLPRMTVTNNGNQGARVALRTDGLLGDLWRQRLRHRGGPGLSLPTPASLIDHHRDQQDGGLGRRVPVRRHIHGAHPGPDAHQEDGRQDGPEDRGRASPERTAA